MLHLIVVASGLAGPPPVPESAAQDPEDAPVQDGGIPRPEGADLDRGVVVEGVVGGSPTAPGDWPDAAGIAIRKSFSCSGVLVAPDVVLSAAHCTPSSSVEMSVILDTHDHAEGGEVIPIVETFIHDDWPNTYDVAAYILEHPAMAAPRPLLLDCLLEDYLQEGAEVSIVGFGATDEWGSQGTSQLHEAISTVGDPDCSNIDVGCNEDVSPGGEVIAGGDGVDSCTGDSGGPLYLHTPDGAYLVGLTSRAALPAPTTCGHGGIYVRADAVLPWIEEVTGRILERPDCDGINRAPNPIAAGISTIGGSEGVTWVDPRDPDPDDTHAFSIARPPEIGEAEALPTGEIHFRPPNDFVGPTEVVVRVTDSAGTAKDLTIPVEVLATWPADRVPLSLRGCDTRRSGAALWLAIPLVLLARRRRR